VRSTYSATDYCANILYRHWASCGLTAEAIFCKSALLGVYEQNRIRGLLQLLSISSMLYSRSMCNSGVNLEESSFGKRRLHHAKTSELVGRRSTFGVRSTGRSIQIKSTHGAQQPYFILKVNLRGGPISGKRSFCLLLLEQGIKKNSR
jgi:hypothetical protein